VHEESNAAAFRNTRHVEDARSVHEEGNAAAATLQNNSRLSQVVESAPDVESNNAAVGAQYRKQHETACPLSEVEQHIVTAVEPGAAEMQNASDNEPVVNVHSSVQSLSQNSVLG